MTRSLTRLASVLALAACLVRFASAQAQAQPPHDPTAHTHGRAGRGAMQLELDHGRPWGTDAPLREGMERIRAAVAQARQADAEGRLNTAQAKTLAGAVQDGIAFMIEHCRLEPKADANLHILLRRLSAAAAAVRADPGAPDGLPQMLEVLDIYPRYFTHPGWQAITHEH